MTDTLLRPLRSSAKEIFAKNCAQPGTLVSPKNGAQKPRRVTSSKSTLNPSNPLKVRVSDNQRKYIRAKAKAAGLTVHKYILSVLMGSNYRPTRDPAMVNALLKLNRELTAQSTNLIQIANHLNGGSISIEEGDSLLSTIARSLMSTHRAVRHALSRGMPAP